MRSWSERIGLVGLVLVSGLAWGSPLGAPFRLLVVLFHELGHAGAALATGGEVLEISVHLDESGYALTRGGWELLVLNAGYLGAQAIGLGLVALGRAFPRVGATFLVANFAAGAWWSGLSLAGVACFVAAALTCAATVAASRPSTVVGAAAGGRGVPRASGASSRIAGVPAARDPRGWMLRWIVQGLGVLAIVHSVLDAGSDFGVGDAALLASRTWIPAAVWSALWITTGTAITIGWAYAESRGSVTSFGRPSGP